MIFSGLSPLARGTRFIPRHNPAPGRFIPAGAGNTLARLNRNQPETVYPRWRGEHYSVQVRGAFSYGLSPLARGTRSDPVQTIRGSRFIPAGAGNTSGDQYSGIAGAVYPRWRGEHLSVVIVWPSTAGLSPLARGTHVVAVKVLSRLRFIPAGAGNTETIVSGFLFYPVYPRWRGEHGKMSFRYLRPDGLSPLARGTHMPLIRDDGNFRFIPAGAGNTRCAKPGHCHTPVYPRWRGEHLLLWNRLFLPVGLSPLARGTPICDRNPDRVFRFIPAGAGNTAQAHYQMDKATVYPRWRGEHQF